MTAVRGTLRNGAGSWVRGRAKTLVVHVGHSASDMFLAPGAPRVEVSGEHVSIARAADILGPVAAHFAKPRPDVDGSFSAIANSYHVQVEQDPTRPCVFGLGEASVLSEMIDCANGDHVFQERVDQARADDLSARLGRAYSAREVTHRQYPGAA